MKNNENVLSSNHTLLNFIKGIFVSLIFTLAAILIFALLVKTFGITDGLIKPINQVIKFVSILIGVYSMFKSMSRKNLLNAIFFGAIYTILAIVLFNLLNGSFNFDLTVFSDVVFGGIAGLISGIIVKLLAKN